MKKLITILLFLSISIEAITITGIGYGLNKKESKKEALSDLSNKISVEVRSRFISKTIILDKDYQKQKEKSIELSSNLPIKGIDISYIDSVRLTRATAKLDSKTALKLYLNELKKFEKELAFLELKLQTTKDKNLKYDLLNEMLNLLNNFEKHKIVAIFLGAKNLPQIDITKSKIKYELYNLQNKIDSLDLATKIIIKKLKNKNQIYISPIKPSGSNEITQFAKIFKDKLSTYLNTVKYPYDAKYFLRGKYEILKDSIFITLNLFDTNNNILKTATITLSPKAYKNLLYKPSTKTFDRSLNTGFVKSGKLYVNIGFKGYERENGIDLKAGDTVDIVVKTNKPICYYLVGYTLKSKEKFAYLLPIGSDNAPFINYLTGDDVTNNVPVEAPFGNETLQIFASTLNKDGSCPLIPPKCEDNEDDYCVINGTPSKVISKTRGLNLRHRKFKIEKAEGSISWSSFEE